MERREYSPNSLSLKLSAGLVIAAALLPILTQAGRWIPNGLSLPVRIFCGFLIVQLPLLLAVLLPFPLTRTPIEKIPAELGIGKLTGADWKNFGIHILPIFILVTLLSSGCTSLAKRLGCEEPTQEIVELLLNSSWDVFLCIAASCILIAPAVEELAFRHILYRWTANVMPGVPAIAAVSLFFAAIHMTPWSIPPLFLLAVILQMEYLRSGGKTCYTILLHSGFNFMTVAAALALRIFHLEF